MADSGFAEDAPEKSRKKRTTTLFDNRASQPRNGLVLVYDLEGFSHFFIQPDVQEYVPKFINHVSQAVATCIYGGDTYWEPDADQRQIEPLVPLPVHEKYLGDGAMYIWLGTEKNPITNELVGALCNRCWNLRRSFQNVLRAASDLVPVVDIPKRIRFGIARGTIYELTRRNSTDREYIGFCINLATRLQKYCPELGFIASARVGLPQARLEKHGYVRVVATQIKGLPREIVILDKDEWAALGPTSREALFEAL